MNANPFDNVATKDFEVGTLQIHKLRTSALISHGKQLAKVYVPIVAERIMQDKDDMIDFGVLADLFVDNIDSLDLEVLLPLMLKDASLNGQALNYEEDFRGKFLELFAVAKWCLEVNFVNFSEGSTAMTGFTPE
jgi:hypothetical protein